jgi:hypothetical protein
MDVRFSITGDLSELFELLNIEVIDIEDEIEFEDDEVEADEDGIEYDSEGVAWWYDEETEVYYYFDEEADDWLEYDESEY